MINWFNCQSTVPGSDTQNCWANQQSSPENPDVSHHLWPWSIIGGSFPFAIERKGLLSFAWRCVSAWARLQWSDYQWKSTTQNATGVYWQYAVITENPGFWLGISEGNRWAPKNPLYKNEFYGKLTKFEISIIFTIYVLPCSSSTNNASTKYRSLQNDRFLFIYIWPFVVWMDDCGSKRKFQDHPALVVH